MFSSVTSGLRRLVGSIKVTERNTMIHIEGLPMRMIEHDFYEIWRTSKIFGNMFSVVRNSEVTFHRFFAPDFCFAIEKVLENYDQNPSSARFASFNYRGLRHVVEEVKKNTWMRSVDEPHADILDFSQLKKIKKAPLEGQKLFLEQYNSLVPKYQLKGFMLASDPGTGKTISGLMLGACLKTEINVFIVPKAAIDLVWRDTLENELVKNETVWYSNDGTPIAPTYKNYVVHYEQLPVLLEFFKRYHFSNFMIWLDESHNLNELTSARSALLVDIVKLSRCEHTIWASGTPIKALGKEAVPFLRTIDNFFDKNAEERFLNIFGVNTMRATDILSARLGLSRVIVKATTVRPERAPSIERKVVIPNSNDYILPVVREKIRAFIMERMAYYQENFSTYLAIYNKALDTYEHSVRESQRKDYQTYLTYVKQIRKGYDPVTMKDMVKFCNNYELRNIAPVLLQPLKDQFKNARSVVKYYPLKVQGEALGRVLGKLRMQCNLDMIPYVGLPEIIDGAKKKTLIFTSYVDVLEATAKYLREQGYQPTVVYGKTSGAIDTLIKRFHDDPNLNPAIATFDSLATAIPVTAANTVVMMNQPYRSYEYKQSVARVDRKGQDEDVFVYDVLLDTGEDTNLSTRNLDIMNWSAEMVAAIMGTPIVRDETVSLECLSDIYELNPADRALLHAKPGWNF